jgi:hypothetical protein
VREIEANYEIAQQVLKTGDFLVLDDSLWDPERPYFVVEIKRAPDSTGAIDFVHLIGWGGETVSPAVETSLTRAEFESASRRRYWIAEPGDVFYDRACVVSMLNALIDRKGT